MIDISLRVKLAKATNPEPISYGLYVHREDEQTTIYNYSVRACAAGGCPAVMLIQDQPDTIFTKQWQYFVYAINKPMSNNAIVALMGDAKALMNNTGFGGDTQFNNYITGNVGHGRDPRLDKLRTFSRNTHAGTDDGKMLTLITFDGNQPPPLRPGYTYPQTLAEVDLSIYLYTPKNAPHLFLVCNNIKNKGGGVTSIFPFDNGVTRPWIGDNEMYSFFPLVSRYKIVVPLTNWRKLAKGEKVSPYRRVS